MSHVEPGSLSDFYTTIQEKETGCSQDVPKMFPRWFPKSDANIVRCFTSTKCEKMLNVKLKSEKRLILTNKCPSNQMSFEGLAIVFYVLPNKTA